MSDTPAPPAAPVGFDGLGPLRPEAVRLPGVTRRGRQCELIDNTGERLPVADLQAILDALIGADRFGFTVSSAAGGTTLDPARPEAGHVQIAGRIYRMFVHRYAARIEPF